MAEQIVRGESPVEYFKELVEAAIAHQGLDAREMTSYYVVNLLAGFVERAQAPDPEPLGIRLAKSLEATRPEQCDDLRRVGDRCLFISGYFSDSLTRSLVDVDYYIAIGERAYGSLARNTGTFAEVFDELSEKFGGFVEVLTEVSERSAMTSNTDVLRLYERWLRTRSRRSGDLLASKGIVPNASIGNRFLQ